ncbi:MAG: NADH-quinone oxidoreductase subunit J, partial [Deltaproteobacteria bacterium]|nr:NADH-quinone oxidoreductase subunit J [Deltaproteobacteria bacterium]
PVHSALSLVVSLVAVAGLFLTLNGEFLAAVQILTYAGAILVLFIFIIMLLNLNESELKEKSPGILLKVFLFIFGGGLFLALVQAGSSLPSGGAKIQKDFGSVSQVGELLFTDYSLTFVLAGVLLTVALVGAVLLAKKDLK